jgi:phosphatidylglycerol---prolipoprotein diacylglyceryl transferase
MLIHPQFDVVAFQIGPLKVHWYGLMYLLAFLFLYVLGRVRIARRPDPGIDAGVLDDLLFFGVLGVILGGRLGQVLFYQLSYYAEHPLKIFAVWEGGMSFHGGFLGALLAMAWVARKYKLRWLQVTDFIAPLVPLGLAAGRFGNFINGELWGRVASPDLPWAMVFPQVDPLPRHPSQLYQLGMEGLLLFLILWLYSAKSRSTGAVSALFLIGYGVFRFFAEYFREPEAPLTDLPLALTMGQWLSVPMILGGIAMMAWALKRRPA